VGGFNKRTAWSSIRTPPLRLRAWEAWLDGLKSDQKGGSKPSLLIRCLFAIASYRYIDSKAGRRQSNKKSRFWLKNETCLIE
jgi:hypothetical protein